MSAHYEAMLSHYGRELGMRNARKHLGWYVERVLPGFPGKPTDRAKHWRALLCREEQPGRVSQHIRALFSEMTEMAA